MRTHLGLLAIASALVFSPAACGSSSSNPSGQGDDGGSGSGGSSGSGSGSSSGTGSSTGSSSGTGSGSSSGNTGSSSGHSGSSSGTGSSSGSGSSSGGMGGSHIKTIFLIVMENNNWSSIKGSSSAPYINGLLTNAQASWCSNYYDNPAANHPSEPNYIWLEAATDTLPGTNNWASDGDPGPGNSTSSTGHLATLLSTHGKTWHEYAEDMTAGSCPIASSGKYAAKHVPFVFFEDISGTPPSASSQTCIANVVPYTQLATDLQNGTVANYNFITPNLCNDMHGDLADGCAASIATGDTWLSTEVPKIMASNAYKNGGAIFITWDESEGGENPIGMIMLSPLAKGNGYTSTIKYYHSSMVRTVQEAFLPGVPLINDAANQPPLSDLFQAGMYP